MRKAIAFTALLTSTLLAGCATSDVLFNLFGDHYTGGGTTEIEKRRDFDQQVEASQQAMPWE